MHAEVQLDDEVRAYLFGVAKLVRFAHKSVEKVPIFIQGSVLP
jgi:hypothetical protein